MSNNSLAERMRDALRRFHTGELSVADLVTTLHGNATALEGEARMQRELIDAIFDLEKAQFEYDDDERQTLIDTLTGRISRLIDTISG
jgi:hypothetical protein